MKDRCWGLILLFVFGLQAFAAEQPLDGTFRPAASSPETVWFYQNTPVKVAKTEYRGFGFLKDTKGGQADGWVEFDVTGWDRFTAQVGMDDTWPAWMESGSVTFSVDGLPVKTVMCKRGQAAQAIDIPLTGKSRLKIEMKIFVLLAALKLAKYDPASLDVTSIPPGAAVTPDGVPTGKITPCRLDVDMQGKLTRESKVTAALDGYQIVSLKQHVTSGSNIHCRLTLEMLPNPLGANAGTERINPRDGATMVWIPAGEFFMGIINPNNEDGTFEEPMHRVYLNGFWLYKYEVTVAQYRKFCQATGRMMPPEPEWKWQETHPIVNVSWNDSNAYAMWSGAALPTEAQWEKAARGAEGRIYPWGDAWDVEKCNNVNDTSPAGGGKWGNKTAPVGSYPAGASPYGCQDMAGNAFEWCADWFDRYYYTNVPTRNSTLPAWNTEPERMMRGGAWRTGDFRSFRAAKRDGCSTWGDFIGFRCAMRLPGP